MTKLTVTQAANAAAMIVEENNDEIKRLSELVNVSLTREQVAFVIASVQGERLTDEQWKELLMLMYTHGTKEPQQVINAAWDMIGFDGTAEEKQQMRPYIEAFVAAHGREPRISPNALWSVLTNEDNQALETPEEWNEAIEEAEPEDDGEVHGDIEGTSDVAIITEAEQSAIKVGNLLAQDAEFIEHLNKTTSSAAFLKIAPLLLMQDLEKKLGSDAMLAAPEPGSISRDETGKETFLPMAGNTVYDIYKIPGVGKRKVRASYYGTVFKTLPPGQEVVKELVLLDEGDSKGTQLGTGPYSQASGWSQFRRDAWRNTVNQRFNNGTKAIRQAFALQRQIEWLKSFKDVHIEPIIDGAGIVSVAKPFWLSPVKADGSPNVGQGEPVSIGQVLNFNRGKTEALGNDYNALVKSAARAPKTPTTGGAAAGNTQSKAEGLQVDLIKDIRQFESYSAMLGHYAEDLIKGEPDDDKVKEFNKHLATNDDLVLSWKTIIELAETLKGRVTRRAREIEAKTLVATGNGKQAKAS